MKKITYLMICALAIASFGCKKKQDQPPVASATGKAYSVAQLRAIGSCTNSCQRRISTDAYLFGVVLADELSGNFYKEIYLRDRANTGAIHLVMYASHCNFFVGDSVHLLLKGYDVNVDPQTGLLEIDTVNFDKHMVKYGSGPAPAPYQIDLGAVSFSNYMGELVQFNNMGFIPADTAKYYADPIQQKSLGHIIQDCGGNQITVWTSNYAKFALDKTPKGNGSIIGIASTYGSTKQLMIRNTGEVNLNGPGCTLYHKKDFEDNSLTSGGWTQQSVLDPGTVWVASSYSGTYFGKCSGYYSSTNHNAESWYISPALNLSSSFNPVLTFQTAAKFTGNPLEVWVSTNYTSGAPSTASWTMLTGITLSPNNPGSYAWTPAGVISLSAFKSANTRIAFKYQSSTSPGATTYELDDIIVREN
ncbi:MAG: DUF5689 domain-containing protein [Bacteroidia bacterium]